MVLFLFFKSLFQLEILFLQFHKFLILITVFWHNWLRVYIDIQILNAIYIIDLRITRIHSLYLLRKIHNVILLIDIFVFFLFFTNFCQFFLNFLVLKFNSSIIFSFSCRSESWAILIFSLIYFSCATSSKSFWISEFAFWFILCKLWTI